MTITKLEDRNNQLEENYNKVTEELESLKKRNLQRDIDLSNEMEDRARRRLNVVVSGIPESSDGHMDRSQCVKLLRNLDIPQESIAEVRRIGRQIDGSSARLIRITLLNTAEREKVLRNARKLRHNTNLRNVYVNPDRTNLQQRFFRELLSELKERRRKGEDVVIFRDRVVRRREAKN